MGTWDAGPFENDAAADFAADVMDKLMEPVLRFVEEPMIDEGFDEAFAAIALANAFMKLSPARPWKDGKALDCKLIAKALLKCFDEQIDDMDPEPEFKSKHRTSLAATLNEFVALAK